MKSDKGSLFECMIEVKIQVQCIYEKERVIIRKNFENNTNSAKIVFVQ